MPWEVNTKPMILQEFVARAERHETSFSKLCQEYDISRKTGYKWLARYAAGQELQDQSRRPKKVGNKTEPAMEALILSTREEYKSWGGTKLHKLLENRGIEGLPSARTITNILKRNGYVSEEESAKHRAYRRFEREQCNELWQADFKGDFAMKDGNRCYPLTILDDHSRYSIAIDAKGKIAGVQQSFQAAFEEYGMPDTLLTDNGASFAGFKGGYTQFEIWLMRLDILPIHGRIMHPQTQGKIERFHRSMKAELLNHCMFDDLEDAKEKMGYWRQRYNCERPHTALGMKVPAQVYEKSNRCFPVVLPEISYDNNGHICKIDSWGYLRFSNQRVYISESIRKQYVQVRMMPDDRTFQVCFGQFVIAHVDASEFKLTARKAYRLHSKV